MGTFETFFERSFKIIVPYFANTRIKFIKNDLIHTKLVANFNYEKSQMNGEVWFKVDAGTSEGIAKINDVNISIPSVINRLKSCAQACPTFVQTCMVAIDGNLPTEAEVASYISLLEKVKNDIQGVHLYGLARPSMQAEAERLSRISPEWLEGVAQEIRSIGLQAYVSP